MIVLFNYSSNIVHFLNFFNHKLKLICLLWYFLEILSFILVLNLSKYEFYCRVIWQIFPYLPTVFWSIDTSLLCGMFIFERTSDQTPKFTQGKSTSCCWAYNCALCLYTLLTSLKWVTLIVFFFLKKNNP